MAEQELVTRSFRVTDETAKKIKEIAQELEGNQQAAFAKLIEIYEWQKMKENIPEKTEVLEEFEGYTSALIRLFQVALTDGIQARSLAYSDFASELAQKDTLIAEMQSKLSKCEKALNDTQKELVETKEQLDMYGENYSLLKEQYESLKKKTDKDADKLEATEKALSQMTEKNLKATGREIEMTKEIEDLKSAATVSNETISNLQRTLKDKDKYIDELSQYRDNQEQREQGIRDSVASKMKIEYEAAVLKLEKSYTEQIKQLTEENQREMKELQKQYMELVKAKLEH